MRGPVRQNYFLRIDFRVPLGRGDRCMPEQFLNGSKIASSSQQLGCEGMTERMRRRRLWKAEQPGAALHFSLNDARIERLSKR